jgi:hypothetical protein
MVNSEAVKLLGHGEPANFGEDRDAEEGSLGSSLGNHAS